MKREELAKRIETLAEEALKSGNKGAASVLYSLSASVLMNTEDMLSSHVVKFSEDMLQAVDIAKKQALN